MDSVCNSVCTSVGTSTGTDIECVVRDGVLFMTRLEECPRFGPQHFSKRSRMLRWMREAEMNDVVRAALFKRARYGYPEHFNFPPLLANSVKMDFAWVSQDFIEQIDVETYVSQCVPSEFKWILRDRLLRPLLSKTALKKIRDRVCRMKRIIGECGTGPKYALPDHASIDAKDDFVTKCVKAHNITQAIVNLNEWLLLSNWAAVPAVPPVQWMVYAENPIHEALDAKIWIVARAVSKTPQDITWDAGLREFVVKTNTPAPEWTRVSEGYWTCERLRKLNDERKRTSVVIQDEFETKLREHAEFFAYAKQLILELDEACFYYPYINDNTHYPQYNTKADVPLSFAYAAQCGFPIPKKLKTIGIQRFFDVPLKEPNDGLFSFSQWKKVREEFMQ